MGDGSWSEGKVREVMNGEGFKGTWCLYNLNPKRLTLEEGQDGRRWGILHQEAGCPPTT